MIHVIIPDGNAMEACDILDKYDVENEYINDCRILVDGGEDFEEILDLHEIEYDIV